MPGSRWHIHLPFVILCAITVALYLGWLLPALQSVPYFTWDGYRDVITARHVEQGGSIGSDPVLRGYAFWYPPMHALVMTLLSGLSGMDLKELYPLTPVLFNWVCLIALFMLIGIWSENPWAALVATLYAFAMPWFVTYVFAFPTVMAHAVGFGLLLLVVYLRTQESRSLNRSMGLGIAIGILGWYHPPTFVIVYACIFLHCLWECVLSSRIEKNTLWILVFPVVITAPYWIVQLSAPVLNPAPMTYVSPAMLRYEMVIPALTPNPFIPMQWGTLWFCGWLLAGMYALWNDGYTSRKRMLIVMLLVAGVGQSVAYIREVVPGVPVLLPHEFQLFGQLLLCIVIGAGINHVMSQYRRIGNLAATVIVLVCVLHLSVLLYLGIMRAHAFCEPVSVSRQWNEITSVIRESVPVDSVIAAPDDQTAFFVIGAQTGRKSLVTFATHMNPRSDHEERTRARKRLFSTRSLDEFTGIVQTYEIDYLLVPRDSLSAEQRAWFAHHLKTRYTSTDVSLFIANSSPSPTP